MIHKLGESTELGLCDSCYEHANFPKNMLFFLGYYNM